MIRAFRMGLGGILLGGALAAAPAAAQSGASDSTLATACAGGGGLAEGLLLVVFDADVPAERRSTAAAEVGGRLAGPAPEAGPDGHYIAVQSEGRSALDAAADRLIALQGVQSVGGIVCPPPPVPHDTTSATDSAGAATPSDSAAPAAPVDSAAAPAATDSTQPDSAAPR